MQKRIILLSLVIFLFSSSVYVISAAVFSDVKPDNPFNAAIEFVKNKGVVSGYPDGTYQPGKNLNRAEFTKIIIASRFSKLNIDACVTKGRYYKKPVFTDVESKAWFESFVCQAKEEGIIGGYGDGSFKPTNTLNFAEAAKIVVKSYGLKTLGNADPWFVPYLNKLTALDAVPPSLASISDLTKRANKLLTRGEMADMIYRLRNVKDTISDPEGKFSLRIPEVSVPDGTDLSKITVRKLTPEESPIKEVNGAPMVFYKLEPTGVKFPQSVVFDMQIPTVGDTIPIVYFVTGDDVEMIKNPVVEVDKTTKLASLSSKIEHFSGLGIAFETPLQVAMLDAPEASLEGDTFPYGFRLSLDQAKAAEVSRVGGNNVAYEGEWKVFGISSNPTQNVIQEKSDEDLTYDSVDPDDTTEEDDGINLADYDSYQYDQLYHCSKNAGLQRVDFYFNLGYGFTVTSKTGKAKSYRRVSTVHIKGKPFKCVGDKTAQADQQFANCRGVSVLSDLDQAMTLPVVTKPKSRECYFLSDLRDGVGGEDRCAEDHYGFLDKTDLYPLNFEIVAPALNSSGKIACGFGKTSDISSSLIAFHPDNYETMVRNMGTAKSSGTAFTTFDGVTKVETPDLKAEDLSTDQGLFCPDQDYFLLSDLTVTVTVHDDTLFLQFDDDDLPIMKGIIAKTGHAYAIGVSDADVPVTATFVGRMYRSDDAEYLRGTLKIKNEDCQNILSVRITE